MEFVTTEFGFGTTSGVFSTNVHEDASDNAGELGLILEAYLEGTFQHEVS